MRLKARVELSYAAKDWRPGDIFDAPREHALILINQDKAEPFNLEDPSTISMQERIENLLPAVPAVSISPTSDQVGVAGGPGSFNVTMTGPGQSGTWTVDKDASATWLTVDSPTSPQDQDGTVYYDVAQNVGAARTANMYVNGQTFTVNQAATVLPKEEPAGEPDPQPAPHSKKTKKAY